MATGDGVVWNEALPDNSTVANTIDEHNRDLRVGMRSRMALEHVWPDAHTGTSSAGRHKYVTFVTQDGLAVGTANGAIWVNSDDLALYFTDSEDNDVLLVSSGGVVGSGAATEGSIAIYNSASGSLQVLAASAPGLTLHTNTNTGEPTWAKVQLPAASAEVNGVLDTANGGIGLTLIQRGTAGAITQTADVAVAFASAFGAADYTLSVTPINSATNQSITLHVWSKATTGFVCRAQGNDADNAEYFAIGTA